jgi:hypothetical protein
MALAMDFSFLVNRDRLLLSIGYRGADGVLDPSCYDLLASEARLASLLAIAKGDAPNKHLAFRRKVHLPEPYSIESECSSNVLLCHIFGRKTCPILRLHGDAIPENALRVELRVPPPSRNDADRRRPRR